VETPITEKPKMTLLTGIRLNYPLNSGVSATKNILE
jgi:hypothetical protein